jgi:hypothetical protein
MVIKPPVQNPSRISLKFRAILGASTTATVGVGIMLEGSVGVGRGVDVAGCSTATGVAVGPSVTVGGISVGVASGVGVLTGLALLTVRFVTKKR